MPFAFVTGYGEQGVRADLREIDSYRDMPKGANPQDFVSPEEWQERQDLFRREVDRKSVV